MNKQQSTQWELERFLRKLSLKQLNKIEELINQQFEQKRAEEHKINTFFQAVKNGNEATIRQLLSKGLDVNIQDEKLGNTGLIYAVLIKNLSIVSLLLTHGADPSVKNKRGSDSFDAAKAVGATEIQKLLQSSR